MSPTLAVVVLIVVIVIVGGAGYVGLNSISPSSTTVKTCSPSSSPVCALASGGNDVQTFLAYSPPFGSKVLTIAQNNPIPVTVSVAGGLSASSYRVNWGDGTNTTGGTPTVTHGYVNQGSYIVSAEAYVNGAWHTGSKYLYPIFVTPSLLNSSTGEFATISASLTNATGGSFGWFAGSGSVSVSATYTSVPSNPLYSMQTPSIIYSAGATPSAVKTSSTSASGTYSYSTPGIYTITFVGPSKDSSTGALVYQNFTWTVYVSPTGLAPGCAQCTSSSSVVAKSPHPGQLTFYFAVPAGGTSLDPAIDYETVGAEPIYNIYQTLVTYNGTSTGEFIPQLATCVPGSAQCTALYGNSLLSANGIYYTFVIDKNAHFYDPATKSSWGVYPSDVMFSMARTLSFADLPVIEATAGWILAQALLPAGNPKWDVSSVTGEGIHYPFNNTPQNILDSMLVNNTTYCPSAALTSENGCITFVVDGPGAQSGATAPRTWGNFLQFVADPLGGDTTPAGWFNSQGLGGALPGWPSTPAAHGDGPTLLPGGVTSTSSAAFGTAVKALSPTAWDATQEQMIVAYPAVNAYTQTHAVGSGPYYQVSWNPSVGYVLSANPAYQQPAGCAGISTCEPVPGAYAKTVTVYWESSDTAGIQQYEAGTTDFASIFTTDTPTMLSLIQSGKIGALLVPTLNLFFYNYALTFDVTAAQQLDPFTLNVPGNFFSSVGLRQFMNLAYPYTTIENTINTVDGIQFGFNYGGAIPLGMGNYYPGNITWPDTDPVTNPAIVGSAAWWWAQTIDPSSPEYDAYIATTCTTSSPCEFPIIGELGAPGLDQGIQLWIHEIDTISGGRLAPNTFDLSFGELYVTSVSSSPGTIPLPLYTLGWAPDYPDPSDYVPTLWGNGSYGAPDADYVTLVEGAAFNSASCGHANNLVYWANIAQIPQDCQGVAYSTMYNAINAAASMANGPARVLQYNLIEHIGAGLSLTQYTDQANTVFTYAPWINPSSLDLNPMWGGDNLWYLYTGNGVAASSA